MLYEVGSKINVENASLRIEILSFLPGAQSVKPGKEDEYNVLINGNKAKFSASMLDIFLSSVVKKEEEKPLEEKIEKPKKAVKSK